MCWGCLEARSLLKKGTKGAGSGSLHSLTVHHHQSSLVCLPHIYTLVPSCLPAGHSGRDSVVKHQKWEGGVGQLGPDFLRGNHSWRFDFPGDLLEESHFLPLTWLLLFYPNTGSQAQLYWADRICFSPTAQVP